MTEATPSPGGVRELGRFLEIQNLGLNLAFAVAFLLLAANGWPSLWTAFLVVVAFVGARNAGHSFNRWADREFDAKNPRTQRRAIPSGQRSPGSALALAAGNGALLVVAAYLLNPLAFVLAPVALVLIFGYSYTKRVTSLTTPFLGLVQAITPAAAFIAVRGTLPLPCTRRRRRAARLGDRLRNDPQPRGCRERPGARPPVVAGPHRGARLGPSGPAPSCGGPGHARAVRPLPPPAGRVLHRARSDGGTGRGNGPNGGPRTDGAPLPLPVALRDGRTLPGRSGSSAVRYR